MAHSVSAFTSAETFVSRPIWEYTFVVEDLVEWNALQPRTSRSMLIR